MWYLEASPQLRLRPSHLLLMIYRYVSGIYQVGDLSALNYVKGFLDASAGGKAATPRRILTVSGHGIGEAEMWLAERFSNAEINAISSRMVDTQLLQFLRIAQAKDIKAVFSEFQRRVGSYKVLSELAADPGLVPYWCDQAQSIQRVFGHANVGVYSDAPHALPESKKYDLIFASHGSKYFSAAVAEKLRSHLAPGGHLAILLPSPDDHADGIRARFANSRHVRDAKQIFENHLADRGYTLTRDVLPHAGLVELAQRREVIHFSVLAPANLILLGELILRSLGEHISDRARLEALNATAAGFKELQIPVNEELMLYIVEAKA